MIHLETSASPARHGEAPTVRSGFFTVRLQQIRWEAEDIASYTFAATDGMPLPSFAVGAHVDVHLPGGMMRSYSLLNDPAQRSHYVIGVQHVRQGRGGSTWMHRALYVGDALHRPWRLHYASRSPSATAFMPRLAALDRGCGWVQHCFGSNRVRRLNVADVVTAAPAQAHLYCCGPSAMLDDFVRACEGRPAGQVHAERFASSQAAAVDGGYEVQLRRSGQRFSIAPGKSILDTLLEHGIDVDYACVSGICGSCRVGVLDGEPDHRDGCLSEAERRENRWITICCSGSRSATLVLDL